MDICKAFQSKPCFLLSLARIKYWYDHRSSRYASACLPAENFPRVEESVGDVELSVPQAILRQLLDFTALPWHIKMCVIT